MCVCNVRAAHSWLRFYDAFAYFIIGEVFFGVLYNLLGVLGLETGVVLGAMLIFFGVAIRLGDGDDLLVAVALDLHASKLN